MKSRREIKMVLAFVIFILLITAAVVTVSAVNHSQNPIITEVYYDTYLSGDTDGEFIRIHNPTRSSINIGGWQITDLEGAITFPEWANINAGSSLYLAYNATAFYDEMLVRADFEHGVNSDPTQNMDKWGWGLRLNDDGDEIILKDNEGEIIDVVIYGDSDYAGAGWIGTSVKGVKSGVILERDRNETTRQYEDTNSSADWDDYRIYVVGQSHFPYETFSFNGNVTVFTSPDSSFSVIANAIDNAQESIYLNVYQFHNFYLMDHITNATRRGVEVKIMLEGDPVNGIADDERHIANETVTAGGEVRFMINNESRGVYDRYAFNHAKYAVIDNESTIVMSENWKNTGVPVNNTFGNRGWGIIINNPDVTNYFTEVFREDGKPASKDCFPFTPDDPIYGNKYGSPPLDFVPNRTIPTGNYSYPFDSAIISGEFNVSPVLAPDTSLLQTKSIIGMIKGAESSVYIEQLYVKDWGTHAEPKPNPFLEAAINASRRGCEVKILLNPTYSIESNQATIDYVRGIAADEGLNLDAKFIDIDGTGLNKTHNKGVIVDRSKVLISSVNWNEYSPTNNREVGLIIENEDAAGFYTDVFFYDWYASQLPVANFTYSPVHPVVNQTVIFNASLAYDPDGGNTTKYEWGFGDETNGTGRIITHSYSSAGNYTVILTVTDNDEATNSTSKIISVYLPVEIFDTGKGTYPSMMGTHNGTITSNQTITVSQLYTYPCSGTGGHSEHIRIYNKSGTLSEGHWDGYTCDYHNITLKPSITLLKGHEYNYTIITGSYPLIHHTDRLEIDDGVITCTQFIDANRKIHNDWIPAIKLWT